MVKQQRRKRPPAGAAAAVLLGLGLGLGLGLQAAVASDAVPGAFVGPPPPPPPPSSSSSSSLLRPARGGLLPSWPGPHGGPPLYALPGDGGEQGSAAGPGRGKGQQHMRRRRLPQDELFLGNLTDPMLMGWGWDVLEPEEEGYRRLGLTVPDVKKEDFRDLKVSLRFGFEGGLTSGGAAARAAATDSGKRKKPVFVEWVTPYALCYPPGTRAKGCQELIMPGSPDAGGAVGLPCTAPGGTCPFVTFTCSMGHTWRAEPGTPACFYCPRCREKTRNVRGFTASGLDNTLPLPKLRGRRRVLDPAARFREAVAGRQGKMLGGYLGAKEKTRLRCDRGHEWEATPENVMRGSWCPTCAKASRAAKRALTLADMQMLAEQAGGRGARCLSEEYRGTAAPLLWACAGASGTVHFFQRAPNYVKKGLAVGRAFCVECEKLQAKTQDALGGGGAPNPRKPPSPSSSSSSTSQRGRPRKGPTKGPDP